MITVTICDVIFKPRKVKLPDKCPECEAGFRHGNNLREISMTEWASVGKLVPRQGFITDCSDDIDAQSYDPVAYACHACGHILIEGKSEVA